MPTLARMVAVVALTVCLRAALAEPEAFTAWDFNAEGLSASAPGASRGAGSAHLVGGAAPNADAALAAGTHSSDERAASAWNVAGFPAQGEGSGTAGVEFRTSTLGQSGVTFEFDYRVSRAASKYWQVLVSTDAGQTWSSPTGPDPAIVTDGTRHFRHAGPFALPAGASNAADVRVRVVAVFGAGDSFYSGNQFGYSPQGAIRFDEVKFKGQSSASRAPEVVPLFRSRAACAGSGDVVAIVAFAYEGQTPLSNPLEVTADLSALGGASASPMFTILPGVWLSVVSLPGALAPGEYNVQINASDQVPGRVGSAAVPVKVAACGVSSASGVVISEVFPGGQRLGAPFSDEYVVLHNRSPQAVDLAGWTIQYAAAGAAGGFTNKIELASATPLTIAPGGFFLVQTNAPDDFGVSIADYVTPDFGPSVGNLGVMRMDATDGRVALVQGSGLIGTDYAHASIRDVVGYGRAATYEGAAAAPAPTTTGEAIVRKGDGTRDTDHNFDDFVLVPRGPDSLPPNSEPDDPDPCAADLDDGTGTGTPDGGVDINDLLYFLGQFEIGDIDLDDDGDPAIAMPDGGTDINDLLFFLARFSIGC